MDMLNRHLGKPISTRTHALLDYLTVAKFLVLPRVMGFNKTVTNGMTAIGLVKLAYTLLTRHEGGVYKVLPMKAHLAMDVAGGAMLCALPFVDGEEDSAATGVCVSLGAFDILAAPLTETESLPATSPGAVGQAMTRAADAARSMVGQGAGAGS